MTASAFTPRPTATWRTAFDVSATLIMLALGVGVLWQGWARSSGAPAARSRSSVPLPSSPIPIASTPSLGAAAAKVGVIVYSDFECPFCAKVARDTIPVLIREYVDSGRLVLLFKHLPLPTHSLAYGAAISTVCASEQGKFWQMHDRLFRQPIELSEPELRVAASDIGMDLRLYRVV